MQSIETIIAKRPYGFFSFVADPSLSKQIQLVMYDWSVQMLIKKVAHHKLEISDVVVDLRNTFDEKTFFDFHGTVFETTIFAPTYTREISYLCYKKLDSSRN